LRRKPARGIPTAAARARVARSGRRTRARSRRRLGTSYADRDRRTSRAALGALPGYWPYMNRWHGAHNSLRRECFDGKIEQALIVTTLSMRARRVSRSSADLHRILSGGVLAQPTIASATSPAPLKTERCAAISRAETNSTRPIYAPCRLNRRLRPRALRRRSGTVVSLRFCGPLQHRARSTASCAAFAEPDVVFTGAAFVGVALDFM